MTIIEYGDIFTYLEFIQTKIELYTKDIINNDLRYKLFKEFIIKDLDNMLDILYKEWSVDLYYTLDNNFKNKEEFVNLLKDLYEHIEKEKNNYLKEQ